MTNQFKKDDPNTGENVDITSNDEKVTYKGVLVTFATQPEKLTWWGKIKRWLGKFLP